MKQESYDPGLIYHYTKARTLIDKIFYDLSFLFNVFSATNDPLEYKDPLVVSTTSESDIDWVLHHEYEEILKKEKLYHKLACFCQDDNERMYSSSNHEFGKGYGRPRIWAQYGNSHSGVCIAFNKTKLLKKAEGYGDVLSGEIKYDNHNLGLKKLQDLDLDSIETDSQVYYQTVCLSNFKKMIFCKYEDFRDESEFRILIREESDEPIFVNIHDCIDSVIIGDKCSDDDRDEVRKRCFALNIPAFEINWNVRGPWLVDA